MRPQSRLLMKLFGFLFAGAILAISATMNWKFGYSLSPDPTERHLFGLASLAVDGLKATLPLFIVFLWRARHIGMTFIALALWLLCFSWSMASAVGFSASTRAEAFAGRTGQVETRNALAERAGEIKQLLSAIPAHRMSAVVKAELDTVDVPVTVWRRTKGCTDFTREDSRQICQNALALRRELAAAEESARLEGELADVQKRLGTFAGIVTDIDPQVHTLSMVTALPPDTVKLGLVLLLATLVEVASAFGITVVSLATSRETMLRIETRLAKVLADRPSAPSVNVAPADKAAGAPERRTVQLVQPAPTAAVVNGAHANGAAAAGLRNGAHVDLPADRNVPAQAPAGEPRAPQAATENGSPAGNGGRQVTGNWIMPSRGW